MAVKVTMTAARRVTLGMLFANTGTFVTIIRDVIRLKKATGSSIAQDLANCD